MDHGRKNEVYRSDHIERRLGLAAVVCTCRVQQESIQSDPGTWLLATPEGVPIYHCSLQYDYLNEKIQPLSVNLPA
jgi:hypothetical protein